jgi:predicted RNase H-like nuclease (RuvC/YqgF family)
VSARQPDEASLAAIRDGLFGSFSDRVFKENEAWLEAESDRLDRYAADVEVELDAQIAALETEIKDLKKQKRAADASMQDKIEITRKIKRMENEVDDIKLSKFQRRKEARRKVEDMLDEFADQLNQKPTIQQLFTLRWIVVAGSSRPESAMAA